MKIGIVLSALPGYSETFFRSKIKVLEQDGHEVVLYTSFTEQKSDLKVSVGHKNYKRFPALQIVNTLLVLITLIIKNSSALSKFIKLERQNNKGWGHIIKMIYFNSHILKSKLDWLHFGFATQAIDKENLAAAIGAKMAISFRGYDINVYPLKFPNAYEKVWGKLDKVHSISDDLYNKALHLGLQKSIDYQRITPAIDIDSFNFIGDKVYNREHIQIFTVARLTWIKGLDYAITAMKYLKDKGIAFTYTIAGDGPVYDRIKYAVHQLDLNEHVIFLGAIGKNEIITYLQNSDIYLQTSLEEGFCNAVLEAQACKCLCIASDVGGLRENIIDNKTGWLIPKRQAKLLANQIELVHNLPLNEKQTVARRANERVKEEFSLEIQQRKFAQFYINE